jgi:hypothetical protein
MPVLHHHLLACAGKAATARFLAALNDHSLEVLTRLYGSAGTSGRRPHLLAGD